MMPNGDPQDVFFYPTLTFMIDSYNIQEITRTAKMDQLHLHKASADEIPRNQQRMGCKNVRSEKK